MRDGDEYVINGQKMWTSLASDADYCWLAVRTDPDAPKHKGISMIIVDMKSPGITVDPLHLLSSHDINATFFDDVRVPAANLVGGENKGWNLITNQLNHERVTLCSSGLLEQSYTEVRRWAQNTTEADGRRVIDQEWVQLNLAQGARRARVPAPHQLEGRVDRDRGTPRHRRTRRRSRSSAPSSTSRPSAC